MLFGKPTKHIRHSNEVTHTIEPQRFIIHTFWKFNNSATTRTDGLDLQATVGSLMPLGSRVTKHKMDILVTPETIEPQQIYMGRIKLSFTDVMNFAICGGRFNQASVLDTTTMDFELITTPICPFLFPDDQNTNFTNVKGDNVANVEIGGSGSGQGIQDWNLDDHIKHWINLKKVTVFDQRPLMGERWQRIPSKVKRINEGCYYGLMIFNDSTRGGTPADTQVTVNIKDYIEEMAI